MDYLFGPAELIGKKDLPHLNKYKYHSTDYSPISRYILTPYWNRLVLLCPLNVAYWINVPF